MNLWTDNFYVNADRGEMELDEGFKEKSILEQLNVVIDSGLIDPVKDKIKKFKPITSVVTDDGDKIKVTAAEALRIRETVIGIHPKDRLDVLKQLQTTKGMKEVLNYIRGGN